MHATRILFVCTAIGMRATLAVRVMEGRRRPDIHAFAAGFRAAVPPESVLRNANDMGLEIPAHAAPTVFDLYKRGDRFDYVITLCDPSGREGCANFRETLQSLFHLEEKLLHWPLPHPGSDALQHLTMTNRLRAILDRLEHHTDRFLEQMNVEVG